MRERRKRRTSQGPCPAVMEMTHKARLKEDEGVGKGYFPLGGSRRGQKPAISHAAQRGLRAWQTSRPNQTMR